MEEKSIIVSRSIEIDKLEKYILGKKSVELEIEFGIPRSQLCRLWRVFIRDPTFYIILLFTLSRHDDEYFRPN